MADHDRVRHIRETADPPIRRALGRIRVVREAAVDIYTPLQNELASCFFPDDELEAMLDQALRGKVLGGPIRTRSKLAKQFVAQALGYRPPDSFAKTQPRFPGQDLDVYVQQTDNLQIWNEEISADRRYVLIRPDADDVVTRVRVVRGQQLANWDNTGALTSKFQARRIADRSGSKLVSRTDTAVFAQRFGQESPRPGLVESSHSGSVPVVGSIYPISEIYDLLLNLVGEVLPATGPGQDRVRGELLQAIVSEQLRIGYYENVGAWPDIVSQALEVKLQTSPTVDLGLVLPTDDGPARSLGAGLRHCDARYVVAFGQILPSTETRIDEIVVVTGRDFFYEFVQFGGLIENRKRQVPLPSDLF